MVVCPRRGEPAKGSEASSRTPMTEEEFAGFYRRIFLPLVRRATWKHGLSKEDARDIVQDAFLLALSKLDGGGNPRAWLIQVVDHLSLNLHRKKIRRARLAARWGYQDSGTSSEPFDDQTPQR
jgi:DNA-directed RNA polymerase specialized sigma24 family protein